MKKLLCMCIYRGKLFYGKSQTHRKHEIKIINWTALLKKEEQCLIRQVQSVHYSEEWSKNKAAEFSKCHLLEVLLGKEKIRWKRKLTYSEAKELNHLVWHKIIMLLIQCRGIFILEIIIQNIFMLCIE